MMDGELEPLLYDWECDLTLDRQKLDSAFFDWLLGRYLAGRGRVAVLGCGTGRVAIPLAKAGWRVLGLDSSPERLAVARSKADTEPAPQWLLGDMRQTPCEPRQDAVIVPYSAFLILQTDADRLACLASIRRAIGPAGIAVIDVSPNFPDRPERRRRFMFGGRSSAIGGRVEYFETVRQQPHAERTTIGRRYDIQFDDGRKLRVGFLERWRNLTPADAHGLAVAAGLRIVEGFADYRGHQLFEAGKIVADAAKHIYVMAPAEAAPVPAA